MFAKKEIKEVVFNPFEYLKTDWALLSAKSKSGKINAMTVGWGGFGVLWGENVITVYVRPERYTKELIDETGEISLSFFGGDKKEELNYLGNASGRDGDKLKKVGLSAGEVDGYPIIEQAKFVITAKVLYSDNLDPNKLIGSAKEFDKKWYPKKNYHIMYIAKITGVYEK